MTIYLIGQDRYYLSNSLGTGDRIISFPDDRITIRIRIIDHKFNRPGVTDNRLDKDIWITWI